MTALHSLLRPPSVGPFLLSVFAAISLVLVIGKIKGAHREYSDYNKYRAISPLRAHPA